MGKAKTSPLEMYRKEALRAAKELQYSRDIQNKIRVATTEFQIQQVMMEGRRNIACPI